MAGRRGEGRQSGSLIGLAVDFEFVESEVAVSRVERIQKGKVAAHAELKRRTDTQTQTQAAGRHRVDGERRVSVDERVGGRSPRSHCATRSVHSAPAAPLLQCGPLTIAAWLRSHIIANFCCPSRMRNLKGRL